MIKPAVVVVGYNRKESLKRLLKSIENANYDRDDVVLIISLDSADNYLEILEIANSFNWSHGTKEIRRFKERQGLKKHILQCGDLSEKYGAVIILEDDLYVAKDYYIFAEQAINYYKDDFRVVGIGLYSHEWNGYAFCPFQKRTENSDVFAGQFSISWGQCWSKDRWKEFRKWYRENETFKPIEYAPERINRWSEQSWGKFFVKYIIENNLYYIIPNVSMSTNFSDIGEHSKMSNDVHQVALWNADYGKYSFLPLDNLPEYDIFFEPRLDTERLFHISEDDIDIDLNATQKRKLNKRYLLTTQKLNYNIVKSYGLSLRPIEMNILCSIQGTGIFLYDTSKRIKNANKKGRKRKLFYDMRGFTFLQTLPMSFYSLKQVIYAKSQFYKKRVSKLIIHK